MIKIAFCLITQVVVIYLLQLYQPFCRFISGVVWNLSGDSIGQGCSFILFLFLCFKGEGLFA